jgi:hypothetical protein
MPRVEALSIIRDLKSLWGGQVSVRLYGRKLRPASPLRSSSPNAQDFARSGARRQYARCVHPPGGGKITDEGIAPREGKVVDQKPGGPDKFLGDDLDQRLKAHGIKTVIQCWAAPFDPSLLKTRVLSELRHPGF